MPTTDFTNHTRPDPAHSEFKVLPPAVETSERGMWVPHLVDTFDVPSLHDRDTMELNSGFAMQFIYHRSHLQEIISNIIHSIKALRIPGENAPYCGISLPNALRIVLEVQKQEGSYELRCTYPEFFNVLFEFALTITNTKELMPFDDKIKHCRCDRSDMQTKLLHEKYFNWITFYGSQISNVGWALFGVLSHVIKSLRHGALQRCKERLERNIEEQHKGDESLTKAIHHIFNMTYRAHMSCREWYQQCRQSPMLYFFAQIIRINHKAFLAIMEKDGMNQALFNFSTVQLNNSIEFLELGRRNDLVMLELKQQAEFYVTMTTVSNPEVVFKADAERLHKFIDRFFSLLSRRQTMPQIWESQVPESFAHVGCVMHMVLHPAGPPRTIDMKSLPMPYLVHLRSGYKLIGVDFPYREAFDLLLWLTSAPPGIGCFNGLCDKHDSYDSRKFGQCAGCFLVSYCSQSCQKTAWKEAAHAHKKSCKDIQTLLRAWPVRKPTTMPKDLRVWEKHLRDLAEPRGIQKSTVTEITTTYKRIIEKMKVDGTFL